MKLFTNSFFKVKKAFCIALIISVFIFVAWTSYEHVIITAANPILQFSNTNTTYEVPTWQIQDIEGKLHFTGSSNEGHKRHEWHAMTFVGEINAVDDEVLEQSLVGVGTQKPLSNLHVSSSTDLGELIISPRKGEWHNSSRLLFLECGDDRKVGMHWDYNGKGNCMELFGINDYASKGPWMSIKRDNGKVTIHNSLHAKKVFTSEIVVTSEWADFVFNDDYNLWSLDKVKNFIDKNGHLPGIPTAKSVKQNGVSLGKSQAQLLQKIEELTLHLIEQNKRINELERKLELLEK